MKTIVVAKVFTLVVTGPSGESLFKGYAKNPDLFAWRHIPDTAKFTVLAEFPGDREFKVATDVPGSRGREVGDWLMKLWSHCNDFTAHEDQTGGLFCRTWHE